MWIRINRNGFSMCSQRSGFAMRNHISISGTTHMFARAAYTLFISKIRQTTMSPAEMGTHHLSHLENDKSAKKYSNSTTSRCIINVCTEFLLIIAENLNFSLTFSIIFHRLHQPCWQCVYVHLNEKKQMSIGIHHVGEFGWRVVAAAAAVWVCARVRPSDWRNVNWIRAVITFGEYLNSFAAF